MDRKKNVRVSPIVEPDRDGDIFDEGDFGDLGSLGESSALFQSDLHMEQDSDWDVSDLAVFNGFEFDDAEPLLRSPRKAGRRQQAAGAENSDAQGQGGVTSSTRGGATAKAAAKKAAAAARAKARGNGLALRRGDEGGGGSDASDDGDKNYDDDDDDGDNDDNGEVVFGQVIGDTAVVRGREVQERSQQKLHMAQLTKQLKTLMKLLYDFREQAAKARQEAAAAQEENKELKVKIEQMREDQNDLMMAQARSGLTGGINRSNARDAKNARDLDAEMRRRRLAKNALLAGVEMEEDEDLVITLEGISTSTLAHLTGRFYRWFGKKLPLGADVRAIQARYGSAVASYFHFYRWLVGTYIFIASPSLLWTVYHIFTQGSTAVFSASFVGIIPSFLAYSSFDASHQNIYAIMVVLTTSLQVVSATVKWIREDKIRKELYIVDEEQKHVQFAKTFLVGWDNSLSNEQEVEDFRLSNGMAAANMLAEINQADVSATRSLDDRIRLYAHRCFGFALYVGVQMAAWTAIVILTALSDNLATGLAARLQSVAWLTQAAATISTSIVPATVTVINAIMPIIIKAITKLEKWDTERTLTYMLTSRMFLAKILNAFIQALSYLLLANPYLLAGDKYSDVRSRVEQTFEPGGFACRLDQAGAGLFQLVVTEFIFSKIINYATLRAAEIKAKVSRKAFVKPEFEVAKRMVGLLYFQALILAAFPFFPMGTVFIAPFLILSFKFEMKLLTTFQSKPKGRLKAHDAYSFFIKFYLATLVFLGVMATIFLIGSTNFAKECSLQDGDAELCGTSEFDADSSTCSPLAEDNSYYAYFEEECSDEGYPACVCKGGLACGPFVASPSAYSALNDQLRSLSILGKVYGYLIDYSIVLWCTAIMLWLTILFQRNSAQTHADAAADREREWMNEAQTTQARLKKQAKLIEKMQLQAGALLFDETAGN